jgi:endonuclease/exonuclease/phosphatase family metal-dependent hydrolase
MLLLKWIRPPRHQISVRFLSATAGAVLVSACAVSTVALENPSLPTSAATTACPAREADTHVRWYAAEPSDAFELARWCRAVGVPVVTNAPAVTGAPPLDDFVTLSWNAHLAEGRLSELIADLQAGAFTGGRPVRHFALLVQELYRRGNDVPEFDARDRSAFAIAARDPEAADVEDYAKGLGLSFLYVPAMRNGAELREDRGNAILSTEPLIDPLAIELPLARQRRVAIAAGVNVTTPAGVKRLELVNAHLEPLSSPRTLWIFKNPRGRQVRAILDLLETPRFTGHQLAGIVLGGDFNMVRGGDREEAYRHARAWSTSLRREDSRRTHVMGRIDYLFFRLADGWTADTARIERRFGSDHHPVLGVFRREQGVGIREPGSGIREPGAGNREP